MRGLGLSRFGAYLPAAIPHNASADYYQQLYDQIGGGDPSKAPGWYYLMQFTTGDPYLYNVLIDAGLIPRTYDGFLTMAAYVAGGDLATGSPVWMQFINNYLLCLRAVNPIIQGLKDVQTVGSPSLPPQTLALARKCMAGGVVDLPPAPTLLDASNAVYNEVTKQWIPKQYVASLTEQADGTIKLVTLAWSDLNNDHPAGTWTWAGPNYKAPVALTIKSTLYDFVLKGTVQGGLYQEEAETQTNTMSDGTIQKFPWIPNSQWTTPADLQARYTIASIPQGQGNPPASSTVRVRFWSDLSQGEQDTIQADLLIARGGKVLYDAPGSGGFEQPGVTWTDLTAAPVPPPTGAEGESIPPPPPGSTLHVPAPGSGLEATLTLQGSSTPVPVSQVPPWVWQWQAAPETAGQAPGAVTGEGAPAAAAGLGWLLGLGLVLAGAAAMKSKPKRR